MNRLFSLSKRTWALIAVTLGSAIAILDGSIVNLALPTIGKELSTQFAGMQWISDGYLLSLSALILLGGSLGDILGHKKVYLTGMVGFGASSLLCALAPDVPFLTVARIIQGIFGALMIPGGLAIINTNFPVAERSKAVGLWVAWSGIAIVAAPFLAGLILAVSSWRMIFLINIPLVALCVWIASKSVVDKKTGRSRKVDVIGSVLIATALAGMTYGLIEGPTQSWAVGTIAALAIGLVGLLAFIMYERRISDPMVRMSLFRLRNFTGTNIMTFLTYGALSGYSFILAIYLQNELHYTAFQAGLAILPVSLFMFFIGGKVGALVPRYGARIFMTIGPLIAAVGILYLVFLKPGDSYIFGVLPGIVLYGGGFSLLVSPLITTLMTSVDESQSGIASGVNNAISRAAGLIFIAVLGLLGSEHVYVFAMVLCAVMTALGGVVSYIFIRDTTLKQSS
ncbi:MAG TPA: MFS transporter [Candidatus Saccharimonadales bacterium]|nr:MFS transporter [Candidatus Saccharimonadales bacterium]